jgi:predicted ATPase
LLERVESLVCLVTSRQVLGLSGEQELALLPLPTPRRSDPLERLQEYASVQLFVDRARAVRGEFQLTEGNAPAVGELCDRLEGLPLALELAAARAAVLSPPQMLSQLEQRFAFLVSRRRDLSPRHRTLWAAIESSYQLLDRELQQSFARLAVFRGGWTLEAAEAVCQSGAGLGADPRGDAAAGKRTTLECLEQLRETSLIGVEERGGRVRYRLLETLREYGWEQLVAAGELTGARSRHRDWYLQLAEQADASGYEPKQKQWLTRLEAELDNLRAVLGWCQEQAAVGSDRVAAEAGLRLARALDRFWMGRGYLVEGLNWLEGALAHSTQLPASMRALALSAAASVANMLDRERSDAYRLAARHEFETVLANARQVEDRREIAYTLLHLSSLCAHLGDLDAGWSYCVEARRRMEERGDLEGLCGVLGVMIEVASTHRDRREARALQDENLATCRKLGSSIRLIHALGGMGHLLRDEGDYAGARALYQESLRMRRELGDLLAQAQSLEDLAVLAGRQGEAGYPREAWVRAIRLLGAAEAFCETLGARAPVACPVEYERTVAAGRAVLGDAGFDATWADGRAMSLEQAIGFALQDGSGDPRIHPRDT